MDFRFKDNRSETNLFLELSIAALAAALSVGMLRQEDAIPAPWTDCLFGFDGITANLVVVSNSHQLASCLVSSVLGSALAIFLSTIWGRSSCLALSAVS